MKNAITLAVLLCSAAAVAQDQPTTQTIETTVVKNRLYTMDKRIEVGVAVGLTIVNQLTDHKNLNVTFAWNLLETFAVELRGGYALSNHTGLARQVSEHLLARNPATEVKITDDLRNLWEMKGNGVAGIRWAPIYGKISLMAELPVHLQAYLWLGGGAAQLERQSVVYCKGPVTNRAAGECPEWRPGSRTSWVASAAVGLRFFTHRGGGLKLEVRSYSFPDSYLIDIDRAAAERGADTGTEAPSPGFTNLALFDIGYAFIF